jgi:hypothetical protein
VLILGPALLLAVYWCTNGLAEEDEKDDEASSNNEYKKI